MWRTIGLLLLTLVAVCVFVVVVRRTSKAADRGLGKRVAETVASDFVADPSDPMHAYVADRLAPAVTRAVRAHRSALAPILDGDAAVLTALVHSIVAQLEATDIDRAESTASAAIRDFVRLHSSALDAKHVAIAVGR